MILQDFKNFAISELQNFSPSASLDVQVLMEFVLKMSRTEVLLNSKQSLSENDLKWLFDAIEKRKSGFPVAYITGQKEFYGYNFKVSPSVLIPKPDTEILVENAIDYITNRINENSNHILTICDMCCGSGCIGISVLKNLVENQKISMDRIPKFVLVDISQSALDITRDNISLLLNSSLTERISVVRSNLFEEIPYSFDLILTNPPYVPKTMVQTLLSDGRNEPVLALDGDVTLTGEPSNSNDGLEVIRNLLVQIKEHLNPYGNFIMETGEYNAKQTFDLACKLGFKPHLYQDLEGQLRGIASYKSKFYTL